MVFGLASFAIGLVLAFSGPGATSPPGGLGRFCCLYGPAADGVLFLDHERGEIWYWNGALWRQALHVPALPCKPNVFAVSPALGQVAVACHPVRRSSPARLFTWETSRTGDHRWQELPNLPLSGVQSLVFHNDSWEVAGHPCGGEPGNCGQGDWRPPVKFSFPAWVRWEENRWKTRGTASWDPQWQELVDAACRKTQLAQSKPCQRYPQLELMLQHVVAGYGFAARSFLLVGTASGKLWAGPADGERFQLLGDTAEAPEARVGQGPPLFVEVETPVSLQEPRRAAFGPVQGTIRHQVPVRRYLAAAALGERLYLLRKGEGWEVVVCDPEATWTVPLPSSYELCPPGPFPGVYGPCQLAIGKTFVAAGPPWVVLPLPEGWDRKPAEPQ